MNILITFIVLIITIIGLSNGDVIIYMNKYGENIYTSSTYADATIAEEVTTCRSGMEKCLLTTVLNDNGFYSFSGNNSFNSNSNRFIEFYMKIEYDHSQITDTPLIYAAVETVANPTRVYLNDTLYVSYTSGEEAESVDLTQWSFVRIKMSDLRVEEKVFNKFKLASNTSNVNIYFGDATFEDDRTSLYPYGTNNSNQLSSSLFIISTLLLLLSYLL